MEEFRHYEFEGVCLDIPLRYDERSGIYIEEYPDFTENPVWTQEGCPVMFAGEDACPDAVATSPEGCPDCGSCKYYRSAGTHSWIGVCGLAKRRKPQENLGANLKEEDET